MNVTSKRKDLTRRHKDLTSQHNYLTISSDGRNMPPYLMPLWFPKGNSILEPRVHRIVYVSYNHQHLHLYM